ncbi:Protein TRANSPORT INHIBITOR RESPONSE 1 [Hibiscus syriacus]|uniref:Protein TRANSPORT INHIBITOR RESPONSE 1 n=1 Tax=Hibiscus syriacus TaxID=106335 RepID=A0A6A2YZY9_HIBSY|nr:protein TRANSPORT INHIBITOR RESPONSE 1-like [Hibiscus syriacus]XP_039021413.1 protein TRANSPORT INHIBITOR RESPONSE 1-like [Hibiscus syriacus]KAE8685204.1 Protein TRANSPORT INHIBITOR RESPONSE 1 [Hibiscus syriacus]
MQKKTAYPFPDEVLEHVCSFIQSDKDRNSVSVVCKSWYEIERWCRRKVFVGNCYAISPRMVIRRFPEIRSIELKGKPHFADFNLVPDGWGGYVLPWIVEMAEAYPWLEEIRLKRMVITDESLELVAESFKNLQVLVLFSCEGFSTDGLAAIAGSCKNLRELDLRDSEVDDLAGHWLNHFPETYTSLVALNISCLGSDEVSLSALERLVGRCPNFRSLLLNREVPLDKIANILRCAPQLVEFGTGIYAAEIRPDVFSNLAEAFSSCKELKSLSGFWDAVPAYIPAIYSVCSELTSLNLSYATIRNPDLTKLVSHCPSLQRLLVLDYIEDNGLEALASSCKDLQELRVFPSDPFGAEPNVSLTERGLVVVSLGCPKLQSVLYFCRQMSNAALVTIAQNHPNFICFRLCILDPKMADYQTLKPLDVGFGAIVEHCKDLRRLSLSGLLTDRVFEFIGRYAKKLEMLSLAFAGETDMGLHHVLSGCDSLQKLEIMDCPFGDKALLANAAKLERMRSLWMSSCLVSLGACKMLGQKMRWLNVEVMDEKGAPGSRPESQPVAKLYIYRSVAGPRLDMPPFVWTMDKDSGLELS